MRAPNQILRRFGTVVMIVIKSALLLYVILVAIITLDEDWNPVRTKFYNGEGRANSDVEKGQTNIAIANSNHMPAYWEYSDLLRKRYGINSCVYSLPDNPDAEEAWVRGYNGVTMPTIERKFGTNFLAQIYAEAKKLHELDSVHRVNHL